MAEPTGTVENSSVLIINHPPSSVMRDWSVYTHRTTQCHSKYGRKITPNSLPSKWTQSRHGLEFFWATHRCKKKKKKGKRKKKRKKREWIDVWIYDHTYACCHSHHNITLLSVLTNALKKKKRKNFHPSSLSEEMRCEHATGSVCEVNSTRPLF